MTSDEIAFAFWRRKSLFHTQTTLWFYKCVWAYISVLLVTPSPKYTGLWLWNTRRKKDNMEIKNRRQFIQFSKDEGSCSWLSLFVPRHIMRTWIIGWFDLLFFYRKSIRISILALQCAMIGSLDLSRMYCSKDTEMSNYWIFVICNKSHSSTTLSRPSIQC